MKRLTLFYIALVLLFGCTKEIQIVPKDFKEEIVLNGLLNQDSLIKVEVLKTVSISSTSVDNTIDDAIVKLFENGDSIGFLSSVGNGVYTFPKYPKNGSRYRLKVEALGKICEVEDKVPDTVKILSVKVDTVPFLKGQGFLQFTVSTSNQAQLDEFFEISALLKVRKYVTFGNLIIDSTDVEQDVNLSSLDPIILANANNSNFKTQFLYTDKALGVNTAIKVGTYDVKELQKNSKPLSCTLILKSLSNDSYVYFNSLYNHLYYRTDPFSLPVKVISNVNNGHGIMGAFHEDRYTINFE